MEQCEAKSALEFVNEVKCRFIQDNTRDKYYHFLQVLKDCMTQVLSCVTTIFFFNPHKMVQRMAYCIY